ncbi:predicted protein [Nematostella vectensis]|uniref:Lyase N-terminal domain-containing protein n=1 Tax=Nematostella vectensis TaxID=45351 RepID=A7SG47_NEMVE|nr:predicted protein [Nematostella vectensis]|eukprot:XP_001629380.1 predicted protein [Nematostella vectensis]
MYAEPYEETAVCANEDASIPTDKINHYYYIGDKSDPSKMSVPSDESHGADGAVRGASSPTQVMLEGRKEAGARVEVHYYHTLEPTNENTKTDHMRKASRLILSSGRHHYHEALEVRGVRRSSGRFVIIYDILIILIALQLHPSEKYKKSGFRLLKMGTALLSTIVLILRTCQLVFANTAEFEFDDQGALADVTTQGSQASISTAHVKSGTSALKWEWPGSGATSPSMVLKVARNVDRNTRRKGGIRFWMYRPHTQVANVANATVEITFNTDAGLSKIIKVNLGFEGWRTAWVTYKELGLRGRNMFRRINSLTFVVKQTGSSGQNYVFIDLLELAEEIAKESRDMVVPYLPGTPEQDARNSYQRTYYWAVIIKVNLGFEGWRTAWVTYKELGLRGRNMFRRINSLTFVVKQPGTSGQNYVFIALLELPEEFAKETRDMVVPFFPGTPEQDPRNSSQRTYYWAVVSARRIFKKKGPSALADSIDHFVPYITKKYV